MKTKLIHILTVLVLGSSVQAAVLTAESVKDLLEDVQKTEFTYKETGMVFGFETIQSCFYNSNDLLIVKNYCFPKKNYPAKGYTLISKKYGIIDLYQEELSDVVVKKDLQITAFPDLLNQRLEKDLNQMTLSEVSELLEDFYYENTPACWSTNYRYADSKPLATCNVPLTKVEAFDQWASETQTLVNDVIQWKILVEKLDNQFRE